MRLRLAKKIMRGCAFHNDGPPDRIRRAMRRMDKRPYLMWRRVERVLHKAGYFSGKWPKKPILDLNAFLTAWDKLYPDLNAKYPDEKAPPGEDADTREYGRRVAIATLTGDRVLQAGGVGARVGGAELLLRSILRVARRGDGAVRRAASLGPKLELLR